MSHTDSDDVPIIPDDHRQSARVPVYQDPKGTPVVVPAHQGMLRKLSDRDRLLWTEAMAEELADIDALQA